MYRFLVATWNQHDAGCNSAGKLVTDRIRNSRTTWGTSIDVPGMAAFQATLQPEASDVYALHSELGILFGRVFQRHTDLFSDKPSANATFDEPSSRRIIATGGRELIESYWGCYTAFLRDPAENRKWILRSPMGYVPCYCTRYQGVTLYFTLVEDCLELNLFKFNLNWRYIRAHVSCGLVRSNETALTEVSELHSGECIEEADAGTRKTLLWNPCDIARSSPIEDIHQATSALHQCGMSVIHSWASTHKSILLRLSGGIDSSIVLGCLHKYRPGLRITCINHYSGGGAREDERSYAQIAASRAQCELIARKSNSAIDLRRMLEFPRTVNPWLSFIQLERDQLDAELAYSKGASAIFSGCLGDVLFQFKPAAPAAAEYVERNGTNFGFLKVAMDAAELDRVSLWQIISGGLRHGLRRREDRWFPEWLRDRDSRVVTAEVAEEFERTKMDFLHPWMQSTVGVPYGKLWQISLLSLDSYSHDPLSSPMDAPRVPALISQPLAELCLRIPTYVLLTDGWDRALARRAFADELPREIFQRTTKGSFDSWPTEVISRNSNFVRELLLDGLLVHEKILDRRKMEEGLPGAPTKTPMYIADVIENLCAEVWLRTWSETVRFRAAA